MFVRYRLDGASLTAVSGGGAGSRRTRPPRAWMLWGGGPLVAAALVPERRPPICSGNLRTGFVPSRRTAGLSTPAGQFPPLSAILPFDWSAGTRRDGLFAGILLCFFSVRTGVAREHLHPASAAAGRSSAVGRPGGGWDRGH
jgi:hypothetical protein